MSVAGTRLIDLNPALGTDADPENWKQIHNDVVRAAYDVIKLKGHTSWGIALCTASIVQSILQDINNVEAVSTCIKVSQNRSALSNHGIENLFSIGLTL